MSIGASFWWWDALSHQPVRIIEREKTLQSGILFSGRFLHPYHYFRYEKHFVYIQYYNYIKV